MPSSKTKPVASAILAVYNGKSTINAAIDSLLTQTVPLELIVVNDGSTDQTHQLVKAYANKLTLLTQAHLGPAIARNLGVKEANTEILLFVDADMRFDPDYAKVLIKPIQQGKVLGTYTTEERVANWENLWARCWNLEEGWEEGKRFSKNPPKWGTDFRAIKKSAFDRVGGFDDIGYTDTWTLFKKLGKRPLATKAVCYHQNPATLMAVFQQARWLAKRPYKLGPIGTLIALIRTSLPVSLLLSTLRTFYFTNFYYFPFKLVYDLGRFVGILELIVSGKRAK